MFFHSPCTGLALDTTTLTTLLMETVVEVRAGRWRWEVIPVKLISFQRDIPISDFPGDVALALAVRFLDLHHWVAEGWKCVSVVAVHRRKDHRVRGEALLKTHLTSDMR